MESDKNSTHSPHVLVLIVDIFRYHGALLYPLSRYSRYVYLCAAVQCGHLTVTTGAVKCSPVKIVN